MAVSIELVPGNDLSPAQATFLHAGGIKECYDITLSRAGGEGQADWCFFLNEDDWIIGYVGSTCLPIHIDGKAYKTAAIGGLIIRHAEALQEYYDLLMDAAEKYAFKALHLDSALLLCLPEKHSFFERRGWHPILTPLTSETKNGTATWPGSVMMLKGPAKIDSTLHLPRVGS